MITKIAPMIGPNYPSPDYPVGKAWEALWAELVKANRRKDAFLDGRVLAEEIAPAFNLHPSTLVALLSRAAKAGILTREGRPVLTGRGSRTRTHYKVRAEED